MRGGCLPPHVPISILWVWLPRPPWHLHPQKTHLVPITITKVSPNGSALRHNPRSVNLLSPQVQAHSSSSSRTSSLSFDMGPPRMVTSCKGVECPIHTIFMTHAATQHPPCGNDPRYKAIVCRLSIAPLALPYHGFEDASRIVYHCPPGFRFPALTL